MPLDQAIYTAGSLYKSFQYKFDRPHVNYNAELLISHTIFEHNIVCDYLPIRTDSFCGMLTIDEDETSILVNQNHMKQKRMFTIAHELGHYFLHKHKKSQFMDEHKNIKEDFSTMVNNTISNFETEANLFASEIMIPEFVLQSMLNFRYNFFRIAKVTGSSYLCLKWRVVRYLNDRYSLNNNVSELLVEDYKQSSIRKNPQGAVIFALESTPNPHDSALKLLKHKEEARKKEYFWF